MRESRPYGSVRGDRGNPVPYRDQLVHRFCETNQLWGILQTAPHVVVSPETEREGGLQWQRRDG